MNNAKCKMQNVRTAPSVSHFSFCIFHSAFSRRSRGVPSGFTSIELVIVILIVAILAAAAAPKYAEALHRLRVDAAARRIVADLATAQFRARAASSSLSVVFTLPPQGSQYQIVGMPDPDHPAATYTVNLAAAPYQARLASASFGNAATIVYNGYGIPNSSGTIVVQAGRFTKTVAIDGTTGMAAIQ